MLGSGEIYYHLTYIDDLVEGFRLCGEHPAAANRTYILAGGEVTTLNELVALDRRGRRRARRRRVHLPVWPFWIAGAAVRGGLRAVRHRAADLPAARRLLHEEPRVRHHARARPRSATRRASGCATASPHAGLVSRTWLALSRRRPRPSIGKAQEQLFAPGTSSRAKYAALVVGRPGLGALLKYELDRHARAGAGPGRSAWRCGRRCTRGCSARAAATSSSARTSCCGIRTRFTSADNVVIDDNCLLDAKGESNRGIRIGDGVFIGRNTILSCKNGDIELGRRREHRLQLRGVFGQPRDDRARAC